MKGSPDLFLEPAMRLSNALLASYLSYLRELRGISYGWKNEEVVVSYIVVYNTYFVRILSVLVMSSEILDIFSLS